jgi:hypothetical protein
LPFAILFIRYRFNKICGRDELPQCETWEFLAGRNIAVIRGQLRH